MNPVGDDGLALGVLELSFQFIWIGLEGQGRDLTVGEHGRGAAHGSATIQGSEIADTELDTVGQDLTHDISVADAPGEGSLGETRDGVTSGTGNWTPKTPKTEVGCMSPSGGDPQP